MNRDELSVYADRLQIEGDIRGEIIALELLPPRPDLEVRREALMQKWLGAGWQGIAGVRYRFGFVELRSHQLARVLATPAAPFIRSVFVTGNNTEVVQTLQRLASTERSHLTRLSIATGRRFERRAPRAPFIVDGALAAQLVRATPQLEYLEIVGNRVLAELPHPTVQRMRVVGYDALAALVDAGPALPAVRELGFAFSQDPSGRITFAEDGLPRTLLARATLPALEALDLGGNELQRTWEAGHVAIFELLSELGVLPHVKRLRIPSVQTDDERAALAHARGLMPVLEELVTGNELPAPLDDMLEPSTSLGVRIQNHVDEHRFSLRQLGELMAARWATFDADTRDAWFELWAELTSIAADPENYWEVEAQPAEVRARAIFDVPLASLGDAVDDDFAIAELAAMITRSREPRVSIRRFAW